MKGGGTSAVLAVSAGLVDLALLANAAPSVALEGAHLVAAGVDEVAVVHDVVRLEVPPPNI